MKKLIKVLIGLTFLISANAWAITPDDIMSLCKLPGSCASELAQAGGYSDLDFNANPFNIQADTVDGADTKSIFISGGGGSADSRGPSLQLFGNEYSGGTEDGDAQIFSGGISGSDIILSVNSSDGLIYLKSGGGNPRWVLEADGDFANNASTGGELVFQRGGKYVQAAVYVPTPVATPVLGTNLVQPGLNVVPTAAANTAMWLGASTPVAGQQFMIYNNAGAAVRIKGAGAAVINGGTAGKYIEMGIGSYMECKTLTTTIQQCPFYTVNGVVAAMPTPA